MGVREAKPIYDNSQTISDTISTPGRKRENSATRRSKDFIIKQKRGSIDTHEQKKILSGYGSKPHNLSKQNEVIQRMLGQPKNPLLSKDEMKDGVGGTP